MVVATAAWFALVAATLGLFGGAVGGIFALLAAGGVAAVVGRRLLLGVRVVRPRAAEIAVATALALLAVAILARPHEYVLGGLDPGVYVNTAALIADEGSVVWQDGALAMLPDEAHAALFREPPTAFAEGSRLIGFYLRDTAAGVVVPHGMHLFPAALAVGYGLFGLPAALLVPPLLAGLATASVALLARRLAGPVAGVLAALLLLLNPAESWFGRYPAAETAVQAFLFSGLLLLLLGLDAPSRTVAALGGACVGLVHLAKIETVVVPLAVGLVFGWLWLTGRLTRVHAAFLVGYLFLLGHAALHAAAIATHYATAVYGRVLAPSAGLPLAAGALLAVGVLALRPRALVSAMGAGERRAPQLWWPVVLSVSLLLLFGWFLRPLDPFGEVASTPPDFRFMVRNRLESLPRLGWYVPGIVVVAGAAGALAAARRRVPLPIVLLLVMLPLEAMLFLSDPRITATYPWAARRWVGILTPAAVLFAAAAVAWLWPLAARVTRDRRLAVGAAVGLVAGAMLGFSLVASAPLLGHRELAGSAALVREIAGRIDPIAIVLLDDDLVGYRFSAPLRFLADRDAFVLFGDAGRDDRASLALAAWQEADRPLYWLRHGEPARFERWGRRWEPVERWQVALPEVVSTTDVPPREVGMFAVTVTLYRASR